MTPNDQNTLKLASMIGARFFASPIARAAATSELLSILEIAVYRQGVAKEFGVSVEGLSADHIYRWSVKRGELWE